jgi:hypothetical protein
MGCGAIGSEGAIARWVKGVARQRSVSDRRLTRPPFVPKGSPSGYGLQRIAPNDPFLYQKHSDR